MQGSARRGVVCGVASALTVLWLGTTAAAQSPRLKNIELCNDVRRASPDSQMSACTALIDAGRQSGDSPRLLAIAHNNRGNVYTGNGEYDRAIRDYDQSIKIDPKNAKSFNNRGVAYQKKGEHDRAIEDFDEAIKLDSGYASPFVNRAESHRNKGDYQRAVRDYDEAIRLQPASHLVWNGRCWTRALAGAFQAALADCNEALRL